MNEYGKLISVQNRIGQNIIGQNKSKQNTPNPLLLIFFKARGRLLLIVQINS